MDRTQKWTQSRAATSLVDRLFLHLAEVVRDPELLAFDVVVEHLARRQFHYLLLHLRNEGSG